MDPEPNILTLIGVFLMSFVIVEGIYFYAKKTSEDLSNTNMQNEELELISTNRDLTVDFTAVLPTMYVSFIIFALSNISTKLMETGFSRQFFDNSYLYLSLSIFVSFVYFIDRLSDLVDFLKKEDLEVLDYGYIFRKFISLYIFLTILVFSSIMGFVWYFAS
jgi:hypothetical protein